MGWQPALTNYVIPVALMGILGIAIGAWAVRLAIFFIVRIKNRHLPNPHENKETMGLPKGAVRTFLALTFTSVAVMIIVGGIVDEDEAKWVLGELGVIITFYFGSKALESYAESRAKIRAVEKATSADEAVGVLKDAQ